MEAQCAVVLLLVFGAPWPKRPVAVILLYLLALLNCFLPFAGQLPAFERKACGAFDAPVRYSPRVFVRPAAADPEPASIVELQAQLASSWGSAAGFFVDGDDACYFSEPYPPDLLRALARRDLSIGPAELTAELAAVLLAIERRGAAAPFFTDFTDNESARVAATKGTSGAASMAPMAHELASATAAAGVTLRTLRVTTKENAVSDALSRDGSTAELVVTPSEMYHDWVSRPQAVQVIVVV